MRDFRGILKNETPEKFAQRLNNFEEFKLRDHMKATKGKILIMAHS
jgi:hypothetical protein